MAIREDAEVSPDIVRGPEPAPTTRRIMAEMAALRGPCIGCRNCRGACQELIDLLALPPSILDAKDRAR